ncbi:MAG: hypothetical protein RIR55_1015 [Bacteroidota bacterium]|jgi:hypothetical protein
MNKGFQKNEFILNDKYYSIALIKFYIEQRRNFQRIWTKKIFYKKGSLPLI